MKKVVLLSLLLSIVFMTGCGCDKKESKEEPNKQPETEEKEEANQPEANNEVGQLPEKEVNGMKFTGASISYVDDLSTFVAEVKNTTKETIPMDVFMLKFKDKDGKEITSVPAYVADQLAPGESKQVVAQINMDLTQVCEVEYEF